MIAFILVLISVWVAVIAGVTWVRGRTDGRNFAIAWSAWLVLLSAVPWLAELGPPVLLGFFAVSNLAAVALAVSPIGRWFMALPLWALVGFHAFRLPLEIVLHQWGEAGRIPMTMTWEGSNLDVITGIAALVLAPAATRSTAAAWLFNVVGFGLLLNVMRVAMLSSPLPFAWDVEPRLTLAFSWPEVLIVPIAVSGALAAHLILFRKLLAHEP